MMPSSALTMGTAEQRQVRHWMRGILHQFISHLEIAIDGCLESGSVCMDPLQTMASEIHEALAIVDRVTDEAIMRTPDGLARFADRLQHPLDLIERAYAALSSLDLTPETAASQKQAADVIQRLRDPLSLLKTITASLDGDRLLELLEQLRQSVPVPVLPSGPGMEASWTAVTRGVALVVDDNEGNRELLSRRLMRTGCDVLLAENGRQALRMARRYAPDLILLDIMMPEMDGYAVLAELKRDPSLRYVPVVMISAVDDIQSVAHCIEKGADDYLFKPFNAIVLRARVQALIERKRLRDGEQASKRAIEELYQELHAQREKTEALLLNILPRSIAEELRERGAVEPIYYEDTTIVFADIAGFTTQTETLSADDLVYKLNSYFSAFDRVAAEYGVEKLKTIGDCYMFAGGLPAPNRFHPVMSILAAIEMQRVAAVMDEQEEAPFMLRIGVHTGPVIAGVVGLHKFTFDVWGDTVNLASRMEACGEPGRVNVSANTYARVKDFFQCERRGPIRIKDGREIEMYFIAGLSTSLQRDPLVSDKDAFFKRYQKYFQEKPRAFPTSLVEHRVSQPQV